MRLWFSLMCLLACAASQAQTLKTVPRAGLWEQQSQTLVNGQDVMAAMRQAQAQMLNSLPPEQRKQVAAMLAQQGGNTGNSQQCVSREDAALMADPKKALAKTLQDMPQCKAELLSVSNNSLRYRMRCDDPQGMTGDFTGEFSLPDEQHWQYSMTGKGRLPAEAMEAMPNAPSDGAMNIQSKGQGRWLSADCGQLKASR